MICLYTSDDPTPTNSDLSFSIEILINRVNEPARQNGEIDKTLESHIKAMDQHPQHDLSALVHKLLTADKFIDLLSNLALDELKMIAGKLEIDYDELPGETKSAKALQLFQYCQRRGRLIDLLRTIAHQRPDLSQ